MRGSSGGSTPSSRITSWCAPPPSSRWTSTYPSTPSSRSAVAGLSGGVESAPIQTVTVPADCRGQVERVRRVVDRLIPQTTVFRPDAAKWPWEVHVVSTDEVNAWAMPHGKIAVYTGLLNKLQPTDDELAAVLGHEIAHALREHTREQISQQMGTQAVLGIAGALFGLSDTAQNLGGMVANVTLTLPKSRTDETEADRIGVELAARAATGDRAPNVRVAEDDLRIVDGELRHRPSGPADRSADRPRPRHRSRPFRPDRSSKSRTERSRSISPAGRPSSWRVCRPRRARRRAGSSAATGSSPPAPTRGPEEGGRRFRVTPPSPRTTRRCVSIPWRSGAKD